MAPKASDEGSRETLQFGTLSGMDERSLANAKRMRREPSTTERTLWRLLSAGKVPKPVRFGRNTRWREAEVKEWIDRGCPVG